VTGIHFKDAILDAISPAADTDPRERQQGEFVMNLISRSFSALALAATVLAAAPTLANARDNDLANSSHGAYPTGANTSTQATGPVLYQFVPQGERYHVVKPATTQTGTANSPAARS
jgi:hypothetical protein